MKSLTNEPTALDPLQVALLLFQGVLEFDVRHAQEADAFCVLQEDGGIQLHSSPGAVPYFLIDAREARVLAARLLEAAAQQEKGSKK